MNLKTAWQANENEPRPVAQPQMGERAPFVVHPGEEALTPPQPVAAEGRRRLSKRQLGALVGGPLVVAVLLASGLLYLATRGPDTAAFDQGYDDTSATIAVIAGATDDVTAVGLPAYRRTLEAQDRDLPRLEIAAAGVEQADRRAALVALVGATESYLDELEAAATLPPGQNPQATSDRADERADELESALAAANALSSRDELPPPNVSATPLVRALASRHQAFLTYEKQLAAAKVLNRRRAAHLASAQTFTRSFDGIIGRYSDSRDELGDWTAKVENEGATYTEAYAVLYQQAERRRQLRDELTALVAPAEFATMKANVLAVMDSAITATEDASRGISEYQSDVDYTYYSYDQTPGWLSFQEASQQIGTDYGRALSAYEQQKRTILTRLSKREPLPKPPA
jgi:hypothetical protein